MKEGDEITLNGRDKIVGARVLAIPSTRQTSRKEAALLYEILSEESVDAII